MAQQIKKKFLSPEVIDYFDDQISSVDGKVEQEKLDRASGDAAALASANEYADQKVLEEAGLRESGDSALDVRITTLEGQVGEDLQTAISELQSSITAEATAREEADSSLQSQVETEKGRIDAILSLSDADKDSFKEIVDLINSVDTENDAAFSGYVVSNNAALAQEVSDRQAGDSALQSSIESEVSRATSAESGLDSRITAVEAQVGEDLQAAIAELDEKVSTEASTRASADLALQAQITSIQGAEGVLFEDNVGTYADGAAGIKDPNGRDGWYFKNNNNKINWYFFDGSQESVTVSQFESIYSVATVDAPLTSSDTFLMAYYTMPQGDGQDAGSWYRSRQVYVPNNSFERGVKSLFYVGAEPSADLYPELPRVQMVISNISTVGPNGPSEQMMTTVFGTNSNSTAGKIELVVNKLGFNSSVFSAEYSLEIKGDFSLSGIKQSLFEQSVELNGKITSEEEARTLADSALDSRLAIVEAKGFSKGSQVVGAELGFIDLDREYSVILSMSVGRLAVHEGEDFTVSVEGGKTRVTWINSLANPSGEEKIETGDKVFWSGSY